MPWKLCIENPGVLLFISLEDYESSRLISEVKQNFELKLVNQKT